MIRDRGSGIGLALALWLAASPAAASPNCDSRDSLVAKLWERYGERPVAAGVTNSGGLVEILTSPEGETWSIVVSSPFGRACMIAAGQWWAERKRPREEEGL